MKLHRLFAGAAVAAVVSSPAAAGACVVQAIPEAPACTITIGAITRATLVVTNGQVACLTGTTVNGSVFVSPGGAVLIDGATITGNITATGATYLRLCGSTVRGAVMAQSPTGFVYIGDDDSEACAPNNIRNSASVLAGTGGYIVSGNTTGGNVTVNDNNAGQRVSPPPAEIVGNTVGGNLTCLRNIPTPVVEENVVTGTTTGCVIIIT